jgi:hypothetical protein|nr:MAG TPA: hypothetical protein [Bacteriophage sp.]
MTAIQTLKQWFSNFKKPTQEQFWAWIDSFWHKSEKIPMESIEGLESAIQNTATAGQLQSHLTDSHAHKELLDNKVDKVPGKKLTTEDFTTDHKQKLEGLDDYDITLDDSTTELVLKKGGKVVNRISLMFLNDEGTKLFYNSETKSLELKNDQQKVLTSIPVSHFVSNIPTNIVVQNGKIKLMAGDKVIDENTISYNDLQNLPDLNFAPEDHSHSWDDIENKPNNLATTQNIEDAISNIQIGGRNLVLKSRFVINGLGNWSNYNDSTFGNVVRIDRPGGVGNFQHSFTLASYNYNNKDLIFMVIAKKLSDGSFKLGKWQNSFTAINIERGIPVNGTQKKELGNGWCVYWSKVNMPNIGDGVFGLNSVSGSWLFYACGVFESTNLVNWSPAPEDIEEQIKSLTTSQVSKEINSNSVVDKSWYGQNFNVLASCQINLNPMENNHNISFRKCFAGPVITFQADKQIIFTSDNQFNGGDGSTAVVSTANNKIYIDIRNI